jgi:hypothetical protein
MFIFFKLKKQSNLLCPFFTLDGRFNSEQAVIK